MFQGHKFVNLLEKERKFSKKLNPVKETSHKLIIAGQGVISLTLNKSKKQEGESNQSKEEGSSKKEVIVSEKDIIVFVEPEPIHNSNEILLSKLGLLVNDESALLLRFRGKWEAIDPATYSILKKNASSLDKDENCKYWWSIDSKNKVIRYGKGEIRKSTVLLEYNYDEQEFGWIKKITQVKSYEEFKAQVFRDPVVNEPPLYVVSMDKISMEDIARGNKTTPGNLSNENKVLYETVAGPSFELNTEDFPFFSQAIEESIKNQDGWCYQKLISKATEFGGNDINETYLRITMGLNGGDSPGVPYVMEIWPPGHYSPIHNHGDSNAVIKVLHGEITVNLFSMLSEHHVQPFSVAKFGKGDVTYITPNLNQVHQLRNTNVIGPTCITIQCYLYNNNDDIHYEFFDYLNENGERERFDPNSDMDFLLFKQLMKKEWFTNHK